VIQLDPSKLKPWHEVQDELPNLSEWEKEKLKESIKEDGILQPILCLPDGKIIDGFHRYKYSGDDLTPDKIKVLGISEEAAKALALTLNSARRNLSLEQTNELWDTLEESRKQRKQTALELRKSGKSQKEVAEATGTDQSTISRWENEEENGNNMNNHNISIPDNRTKLSKKDRKNIFEEYKNSNKTQEKIAADYKISRRRVGQIVQKEREKREKEQEKEEALKKGKEKFEKEQNKYEIKNADFTEIELEPESIDHIITDPPYGKDYLHLWRELSKFADRYLKPSGFCIAMSGKYHLPKAINALSENLEYYWQIALILGGNGDKVPNRKIRSKYKPFLVFAKPPVEEPPEFIFDIVEGAGSEKDRHEWQQGEPELVELIEKFTYPNDFIVDPMAGAGTTLSACMKAGRRCLAIDEDEEAIKEIYHRVGDRIV